MEGNGKLMRTLWTLLPLLERGGPVVSLALLVLGAITFYFLLGELHRQQAVTRELVERLVSCLQSVPR